MQLEKQVTSLELSKRIKELGVKQESLFWWHRSWDNINKKENEPYILFNNYEILESDFSAFTVAELGELLPVRNYNGEQTEDLANWSTFKSDDKWICHLSWRYTRTNAEHIEADTEADVRAKMLIYLLENKLIEL